MKNKYRNTDSAIKAGDLIFTEQPFAFVLSSEEKGLRCDNCLEKKFIHVGGYVELWTANYRMLKKKEGKLLRGKVLKCSGCQFVHYCGRICQREAWSDHKWECANLKRVAPKVIPDAARMLAKIINRLTRGDGHSYRAFYSATSFRMWKDLMSHYSDLKSDMKRMEHFTSLCGVLHEFLKDISLPNTVELMGIYGRMVINSFTILDTDMNSIGTAIYLGCSIIDHSCSPNAVAIFEGKTISIRATKDMPYLDWDQVRISYIDLMKTPCERQTELLKSYYFLCQCDRCMDESEHKFLHAAKCLNSQCSYPVNIPWKENCKLVITPETAKETNGQTNSDVTNGHHEELEEIRRNGKDGICCEECGTKFTENHIEKFIKAMELTELHLQNMKGASVAYVDVCKYCLDRQEGVMHPLNVMHALTLDYAFDALIQVQSWEQACKCAEKLIPCFKFYYGELHPLLGLLHLKYGKILLYKMDIENALIHFKCSEKILKITHGDRHPLYKEQLLPLLHQAVVESS